MANIVIFDPNSSTVANRVTGIFRSAHTPAYDGIQNKLVNPTIPTEYAEKDMIVENGAIRETTAQEKADIATAESAANTTSVRTAAKASLNGVFISDAVFNRAFADILIDEINSLRQWIVSFKVEVAAASNLADLKTRVAGLPNMPDRTRAQLKTALINRVDSGNADS